MKSLLKANLIRCIGPKYASKKYLLAVSGGPDSMAMLHGFLSLNLDVAVAHVNYKQRGEQSDLDEELVRQYSRKWEKEFFSLDWPHGTPSNFQEKARTFRRNFFNQLCLDYRYHYVVLGHHAQDRVESFLYNATRSSGIAGLSPMPMINGNRFRPFINVLKSEILNYIEKEAIPFREDKSNQDSFYHRNLIRHQVIPPLLKINPKAVANINRGISHLQGLNEELIFQYEKRLKDLLKPCSLEPYVEVMNLNTLRSSFKNTGSFFNCYLGQKQIKYSHAFIENLVQLSVSPSTESKTLQIENYCFEFFKDQCFIYPQFDEIINLEIKNEVEFLRRFNGVEGRIENGLLPAFEADKLYVDAGKINYPLRLRNCRQGDRFKPLGMQGKSKKISDLFTDFNYSAWQKQRAQLLVDANEEIIILDQKWSADVVKLDRMTTRFFVFEK